MSQDEFDSNDIPTAWIGKTVASVELQPAIAAFDFFIIGFTDGSRYKVRASYDDSWVTCEPLLCESVEVK